VAWGSKYIKNLFEISIRSLLSSEKIKEILQENTIHFLFVTNEESKEYIINYLEKIEKDYDFTSSIKILKNINRANFLNRINIQVYDKYQIHSYATQLMIDEVNEDDYLIVNYSDFVWSSKSLNSILKKFEDPEIDVISCHPLTLNGKSKEVTEFISSDKSLYLTSEKITDLSLQYSEWWYQQYRWANNRASDYLSLIYFPIDNSGYLFRGFHTHPLAFKGKNHSGAKLPNLDFGTLDGYYLPRVLQKNKWNNYFIQDLSDLCIGAISDDSSAQYEGTERNFINKLRDHVLMTHNEQEIENSKYYCLIVNKKVEKHTLEKIVNISKSNIDNAISNLNVKREVRDFEYLINQRQINQNLNNLTDSKYKLLILILVVSKFILNISLRPLLFIIRLVYKLNFFSKNIIMHHLREVFRTTKISLIKILQKFFNSKIIIESKDNNIIDKVFLAENDALLKSKLSITHELLFEPYIKSYFEFLINLHRREKHEYRRKHEYSNYLRSRYI